ncbi:hypothetical protein DERF_005190 [Dermatophagoides farinae]|uniref:Uncharacterized protein n=1 Tax=Dermatophagoides farinae TaxID=6954 RepID=A0A922I6F3_DERFA|nr:hypothetical protein DERF_005190 [Dermatophagoides farinae]
MKVNYVKNCYYCFWIPTTTTVTNNDNTTILKSTSKEKVLKLVILYLHCLAPITHCICSNNNNTIDSTLIKSIRLNNNNI